jgi:hypothetical protein
MLPTDRCAMTNLRLRFCVCPRTEAARFNLLVSGTNFSRLCTGSKSLLFPSIGQPRVFVHAAPRIAHQPAHSPTKQGDGRYSINFVGYGVHTVST